MLDHGRAAGRRVASDRITPAQAELAAGHLGPPVISFPWSGETGWSTLEHVFEFAAVMSTGVSLVEEELCAALERWELLARAGEQSGPAVDRIDVPLREALPAPGGGPSGRVWLLDEGAAHREGPRTELGRLLECGAAHLERAHAIDREMAHTAAERARALAAFARMRPAAVMDRAAGEVGAASAASRAARPPALEAVSEWAADEVAAKLSLSPAEATALLTDCLVLVEQLPATVQALEQGRIGWEHARVLARLLAPVSDDKRATIEALVLARADGKSRTQLRVAARRAILREDAAASIERAAAAIRGREVRVYPGEDGMADLSVTLPVPVARACLHALERNAEACAVEGDERTKAQRMVDCFTDLVLRPGTNGLPPVQVQLTVVAAVNTLLGGDEPGEVDGDVVPAALVRELAHTLGLLPRPGIDASSAGVAPTVAEPADAAPTDAATTDFPQPETPRSGTPTDDRDDRLPAARDPSIGHPDRRRHPGPWFGGGDLGDSGKSRRRTTRAGRPAEHVADERNGAREPAPGRHRRRAQRRTARPDRHRRTAEGTSPGPATREPWLPAIDGAGPVRPAPRSPLSLSRLSRTAAEVRPRPHVPVAVGLDVARQPLLPVRAPSPAQPPGSRLAALGGGGRRADVAHAERRHDHHVSAGLRYRRAPSAERRVRAGTVAVPRALASPGRNPRAAEAVDAGERPAGT
jgi:hypothetical protein